MGTGAKGWARQLDSLWFIHNVLRISWFSFGICKSVWALPSLMRVISSENIISGNADAAQFYSPLVPFLFLSHSLPPYLFLPLHLKISLQWAWCLSSGSGLSADSLENHSLSPSPPVSSLVSGIQSLSVPFSTLVPDNMTIFTNYKKLIISNRIL